MLEELGLEFIGFEFQNKKVLKGYKAAHPSKDAIYCLDKWHEYETSNPRLFVGMYQFWVRKYVP